MYLDRITVIRLTNDAAGYNALRPITPDPTHPEVELTVGLGGILNEDRILWIDAERAAAAQEEEEEFVTGLLTAILCSKRPGRRPKAVAAHRGLCEWCPCVPPSICELNRTGSRWRRVYDEAVRRVEASGCAALPNQKMLLAESVRHFVTKAAKSCRPQPAVNTSRPILWNRSYARDSSKIAERL
jgi:hypothetical protein